MAALLRIKTILITSYCRIITNNDKNSLQIMPLGYYKLLQLITNYGKNLLKITTKSYYKLR